MNTTTQPQMTTERSAPGLSLLASQLAASLQGPATAAGKRIGAPSAGQRAAAVPYAHASYRQQASQVRHHAPIGGSFDAYRGEHAHHIRGGHP